MIIAERYFPMFEEIGTVKRYRSGETVFSRGDAARSIYLIRSGRVQVSTTLRDGRLLTFAVLKKGRLFGDGAFCDNYLREVDISSVTDVELVECETGRLIHALAANEELLRLVLRHIVELSNEMTHQLVRLARYDGRQKVADYILVNAGASGSLPYTHSELADCLGMNRVTVSRILQQLRAEGLIDYRYGSISILDRDGLEGLLNELTCSDCMTKTPSPQTALR